MCAQRKCSPTFHLGQMVTQGKPHHEFCVAGVLTGQLSPPVEPADSMWMTGAVRYLMPQTEIRVCADLQGGRNRRKVPFQLWISGIGSPRLLRLTKPTPASALPALLGTCCSTSIWRLGSETLPPDCWLFPANDNCVGTLSLQGSLRGGAKAEAIIMALFREKGVPEAEVAARTSQAGALVSNSWRWKRASILGRTSRRRSATA